MRKILSLLFLCLIFLCNPMEVRADDADDLLKIYGKSYNLPDTSDTEMSIAALQEKIEAMESVQTKNKEYNEVLHYYNDKQQEKLNEANKNIGILSRQNKMLKASIENNLIDAPWEELMEMDAQYKQNIESMSAIADSMNNIEFVTDFKQEEFGIESLRYELQGLEQDLAISIEAEEIGDVTDIKWIMDNEKKVTSKFGYRLDPITKDKATFHSGTDYRASTGTELYALFNGVVIDCGYSASAGNYITVLVNERIKYFVCHLSEIKVEKDDVIKQYDLIGLTGGTGYRSTGPHLHIALYIDGVAVDIAKIFG